MQDNPTSFWVHFALTILLLIAVGGIGWKVFVQRTDETTIQRGGQQTAPDIHPGLGGCAITKIYTAKESIEKKK